jgi:hypothetical protein
MEARGWRLEAKAKPLEDTLQPAQYTMYGRTKGAGHDIMSCAFCLKPIDLTLLNNPTSSYIEFFALCSML